MTRELQDILDNGEIDDLVFDNTYTPSVDDGAATKQYVDAPWEVRVFTPVAEPSHAVGQLFFDEDADALVFQPSVTGSHVHLGQEHVLRVVNKSGSIIQAGTPCAIDTFDATTGLPAIVPGQADAVATADIAGFTTTELADDGVGFLLVFGVLHDFDTSTYSVNDHLWLSAAAAGGVIAAAPQVYDTLPDITTYLGRVISSSATGTVLVDIKNFLALPSSLGLLEDVSMSIGSVSVTYANIEGYDTAESINMPSGAVDKTAGTITLPSGGWFRAALNVSVDCLATEPTARALYFKLLNTTTTGEYIYPIPVPRDQQLVAGSFHLPFQGSKDDVMILQIAGDDFSGGVLLNQISFDIKTIQLR